MQTQNEEPDNRMDIGNDADVEELDECHRDPGQSMQMGERLG